MVTTNIYPIALALAELLGIVICFVVALAAAVLVPLMLWSKPAHALVIRNFVGYFSNPTGYVFLTAFVALTSWYTYTPEPFFNNNLASLEQLNLAMPWILLVFIPAITMSIWAEEQQQGTDELLLTLPATDFDIVLGKYLAAAAIYTASLIFAMFTTVAVMDVYSYGEFDVGLFAASFFGYWLMGLAMLAIGMVGSFFTSNLTVAFVLGMLFNLPLAITSADLVIPAAKLTADTLNLAPEYPTNVARAISHWSLSNQFSGFAQGSMSFASTVYFLSIVAIGIYLSIVLIARRHWLSGPKSTELMGHFAIRTLSLIAVAIGVNYFLSFRDLRLDATSKQVASLSTDARQLIGEIKFDKPIVIEAFIGQKIPTPWLKTRYDLIAALQEFNAVSGGKVQVRIHDGLELSSDEALRAEKLYNIKPDRIQWNDRGVLRDDEVLLGASISCGLKKQTIPFFNHGVPVEYELSRVIASMAEVKKKKLGILRTDANFLTEMDTRQTQLIVAELRQQYDLVDINPDTEIVGQEMDLMLAVQPSSLSPPQMDNFVAAVESGIPTAIFEDPLPWFMNIPGTDQPKRPNQQMMMFGQPPEQKGDIRKLFKKLGVDFIASSTTAAPGGPPLGSQAAVIWQSVNPYATTASNFPDEWVFVTPSLKPAVENALPPFNPAQSAVKDFQEVLFPFPGAIVNEGSKGVTFTPLVVTGHEAGRIAYPDVENALRQQARAMQALKDAQGKPDAKQYILAALIESEADPAAKPAEAKPAEAKDAKDKDAKDKDGKEKAKPAAKKGMRVTLVSDIDLLASVFVTIRQRPPQDPSQPAWRFQNTPFVLNVLDLLAGDDRFLNMRQRESSYVKLRLVDEMMEGTWKEFNDTITSFVTKAKDETKKIQDGMKKEIEDAQERIDKMQREGGITRDQLLREIQGLQAKQAQAQEDLDRKRDELEKGLKRDVEQISRRRDAALIGGRNSLKMWAVLLPLVLPLLLALIMWIRSLLRERDTVPRSRNIYTMRSEHASAGR